jgi:serine protease AprX
MTMAETRTRPIRSIAVLTALSVGAAAVAFARAPDDAPAAERMRLIVATEPGHVPDVAEATERLGADVITTMANVDSFVIDVPAAAVDEVAAIADVASLAPSATATLHSAPQTAPAAPASSAVLADTVNADNLWAAGLDGRGVDVVVIDSGVAPVAGLAGKVINGPDFSSEAALPNLAGMDGLGHGTHMAGIIAGSDPASGSRGVAPGSRIINVKVAAHDGLTSVESVIRALDWVVAQKKSKVYNIRVVNLSFGVEGITDYVGDPLSIAVETAWREGIVVVVSAGNDGTAATSLGSPATNPYVLAVGAADIGGTAVATDDKIAAFSSMGTTTRMPDVVAPGVGVVSLRVPGSVIDDSYPEARISDTLFRGNGTSQSAAVVSGLVALMVQANPSLTPNEIKARLKRSAKPLPNADSRVQGAGMVDANAALLLNTLRKSDIEQKYTKSGKDPLKTLQKLIDGSAKGKTTQNAEAESAFDGNRWRGNRWRDDRWQGNRWRGDHWE